MSAYWIVDCLAGSTQFIIPNATGSWEIRTSTDGGATWSFPSNTTWGGSSFPSNNNGVNGIMVNGIPNANIGMLYEIRQVGTTTSEIIGITDMYLCNTGVTNSWKSITWVRKCGAGQTQFGIEISDSWYGNPNAVPYTVEIYNSSNTLISTATQTTAPILPSTTSYLLFNSTINNVGNYSAKFIFPDNTTTTVPFVITDNINCSISTPNCPIPVVTQTLSNTNGIQGQSLNITATVNPTTTITGVGGLPNGVTAAYTLDGSGGRIITLTGTPSNCGTFNIVVNAENNLSGCTNNVVNNLALGTLTIQCPNSPTFDISKTDSTCNLGNANSDASIIVNNVLNGDKFNYSTGSTYTGNNYSLATGIINNTFTIPNLSNPTTNQIYTIRVYNGNDNTYTDKNITINNTICLLPDCITPTVFPINNTNIVFGTYSTHIVTVKNATTAQLFGLPTGLTYTQSNSGQDIVFTITGTNNQSIGNYNLTVNATNSLNTCTSKSISNLNAGTLIISEICKVPTVLEGLSLINIDANTPLNITFKIKDATSISILGLPLGLYSTSTMQVGSDLHVTITGQTANTGNYPISVVATNNLSTCLTDKIETLQIGTLSICEKVSVLTNQLNDTIVCNNPVNKEITIKGTPSFILGTVLLPVGLSASINENVIKILGVALQAVSNFTYLIEVLNCNGKSTVITGQLNIICADVQDDFIQSEINRKVSGSVGSNDTYCTQPAVTTFRAITNTLNGNLIVNTNGSFDYTPFVNFTGFDEFEYEILCNGFSVKKAKVKIEIVNNDPCFGKNKQPVFESSGEWKCVNGNKVEKHYQVNVCYLGCETEMWVNVGKCFPIKTCDTYREPECCPTTQCCNKVESCCEKPKQKLCNCSKKNTHCKCKGNC